MSYAVDTPVFQGPFDLLLHLILRDQVDLYELRLSDIVDAYLVELERMESLDLEIATEFLMIAATLVELKTRRLLPKEDDPDLDDELVLWEERDLLLSRLLECKTFKDAARMLQRLAAAASRSFPRTAGLDERFIGLAPDPLEGLRPEDLRRAFLRATTPKPVPTVDISHLGAVRASVSDTVHELVRDLPRIGRTSFRRLCAGHVERIEIVVRFLAVLELYKQGLVDLDQLGSFGEIQIVWIGDQLTRADLDLVDAYDG